jgi:hypothetical protein
MTIDWTLAVLDFLHMMTCDTNSIAIGSGVKTWLTMGLGGGIGGGTNGGGLAGGGGGLDTCSDRLWKKSSLKVEKARRDLLVEGLLVH